MAQVKKEVVEKSIFPLEDNVEIPNTRDYIFVNTLKNTLDIINVGQSFVIPKAKHWKVNKIAKQDFEHIKLISGIIMPDKKFVRIKRVA